MAKCPFSMGVPQPGPVRGCERHKCGIWDGTEKKGQCGLLSHLKKLQYIGDMLSALDDNLKAGLELARHITGVKE